MTTLRMGVIGSSPGNGHPYSWSAIFNGYEPRAMADCPYPAIPDYLARQRFPRDAIAEGRVTHIWTQDRAVSEHIAAASLIENVVDRPEAMLGAIDALLLARDDAGSHHDLAAPFLKAGLPVYIDKPLALDVGEAERIYACERRPGQVFTCTALAFAEELRLSSAQLRAIGSVCRIDATTPKHWDTYAAHIIEPSLNIIRPFGSPRINRSTGNGGQRRLDVKWPSGHEATFTATGHPEGPIAIVLSGEKGTVTLTFSDAFTAFRAALQRFVDVIQCRGDVPSREHVLRIVELIEAGRSK